MNSGGRIHGYSSSNTAKVQQNMKKKSNDSASSQYYRQESGHHRERPHRTSSSRDLQQTQRGLPIPSPASSTGKMSSRSGVDVVSTRAPTKEEVLESSYESEIDDPNHGPHSVYDQHRARPTSSSTYNDHAPIILQQRPPAHIERDFEGNYSYNHANTTGNHKSSSRTPVVRSSAKQPLLVGFKSAAQKIEIHQDHQEQFHLALDQQENDVEVALQRPRTKDHVVEKQYFLDDNDRPMSRTMTPLRYKTAAPMYSTYSTANRYDTGTTSSAPKRKVSTPAAEEVEDFDATTATGKVKIVTASSSSSYSSKRPPGSLKTPSSSKRVPVTEVNLLQDDLQGYVAGRRSRTTGDSFHPNSRTVAAAAPRSRGRYGAYNHEEHTATATAAPPSDPVLISTRKLHRKHASTPGEDVDFNQYETQDVADDQEALHNYNLYSAKKISKPHPISSVPSYSDACRAGCGLYERNTMWKKRIESRCYEKKEEQEREKLAECTFTPRLLNSATKTAKSPMFFAGGQSSSTTRGAAGEENNSKPKRRRRPQSARAAMTSSSKANRFIRTTPLPNSARRTGDQEQYQQSNFFKRQELWQQFVEDKIEKKRRKSMQSMYEEQRKMESIRRANSAQATHPRELTLRMRQFYENNLEWV